MKKLKKTLTNSQLAKRIEKLHNNFDRTTVREVVAILRVMAVRAQNEAKRAAMTCDLHNNINYIAYNANGSEFLSETAYELDPGYERNFK